MDRLLALQACARVVELGGFTKAADSLQLSKTTVISQTRVWSRDATVGSELVRPALLMAILDALSRLSGVLWQS
jgi:hypothetical protein